jgi:hypothetical protein
LILEFTNGFEPTNIHEFLKRKLRVAGSHVAQLKAEYTTSILKLKKGTADALVVYSELTDLHSGRA